MAVGEEGSIAQASERVNVSSPSISAAISQLEEEFGLSLFVRKHAHGLSLTQAGRQFMEQAKKVLSESEDLNRLAGDISGIVQGPLNIGCLLTFAQMLLPSIRREFERKHPATRIRQFEADQLALIEQLRRADIDVALSYDLKIPPDLEFVPLRRLPPYAMVPAGHALAEKTEVTIEELLEHPMVLLDLPLSADYFLSFFEAAGRRPKIVERTRDMAVMRSLVANGFGYAIANIRPNSDLSPDGLPLHFVPLAGDHRPMRLGLIIPKGGRNVLTVNAFITHTAEMLKRRDHPGLAINGEP